MLSAALLADDGERFAPCPCEWCKRYGTPDVFNGIRPPICKRGAGVDMLGFRGRPAPCLEKADRCTQRDHQLGDAAYWVQEQVVAGWHYFNAGGNSEASFFNYESKLMPVCKVCLWDEELEQSRYWVTCAGCGRRLSTPRWRTIKLTSLTGGDHATRTTCNDPGFRRALRKRRRPKNYRCTCGTIFSSARTDAWFCSCGCRQAAYRQRGRSA